MWAKLGIGNAGMLKAVLHVDGDGHLGEWEIVGQESPKALASVVRRTVPLLKAGTFAVKGGGITAGTETIELSAVVSDETADGAEGGRDNLAFSFSAGRGQASFTQTGGRHVEITVRVVSIEVSP